MLKIALVKYENIGSVAMSEKLLQEAIKRHVAIIESIEFVEYKPMNNDYVGKRLASLYVLKYKSNHKIALCKALVLDTLLADISLIEDATEYKFVRSLESILEQ